MLLFLFQLSMANPNGSWLQNQSYPSASLLPKTLSKEHKREFLHKTHAYLIRKFSQTSFQCVNGSALHFPFSKSQNTELQKTYAIETKVCIPNFSLSKAAQLYMDPIFRTNHMSGVAKATKTNSEICVTSDSFIGLIKTAYFCLTAIEKPFPNGLLIYSYLSKNRRDSGYQPVYFQEEFIYFQQINTDVLIHRISVNRSRELGSAGEYVLKQKLQEYPSNMITSMKSQP